jgi:predicted HTH domain antitoxin
MVSGQLEIPQGWADDPKDRATLLKVLSLGLQERRLQRALALYQQGAGSLVSVSELLGLPRRVLMEKARQRGVLPQHDPHFADQDLAR